MARRKSRAKTSATRSNPAPRGARSVSARKPKTTAPAAKKPKPNAKARAAQPRAEIVESLRKRGGKPRPYPLRGPDGKFRSPGAPKIRRNRRGQFLPAPGQEVEAAYLLRDAAQRREMRRKRRRPVKVFYVVDGAAQRRFDVETWDQFMTEESYGGARDELLENGEFWLGYQDLDSGDIDEPIVQLT